MFHSVSLLSQEPLARGSCDLPSVLSRLTQIFYGNYMHLLILTTLSIGQSVIIFIIILNIHTSSQLENYIF